MDDIDMNLAEEVEDDCCEETLLTAETEDDASESVSEAGSGRGRKAVTIARLDPLKLKPVGMSI